MASNRIRKTPSAEADDFDVTPAEGVEYVVGSGIPADVPAEPAPVVTNAAPVVAAHAQTKRRKSVGERFAEALGYRRFEVGEVRLPAPPEFSVETALAGAPDLQKLRAAVARWREIRAPMVDLTPQRIRERVAEAKDRARFDSSVDASKAAEEIVTLERRLTEENALREAQMRYLFKSEIVPLGVSVIQSALPAAREALASAEKIDAVLRTSYGAQSDVAGRYRAAVEQLQGLVDELTGERGNISLHSMQGRFFGGHTIPDLIEAVCPESD